MELAKCQVAIGNDSMVIVEKYPVTPAELHVLRAINGEQSVQKIEPLLDANGVQLVSSLSAKEEVTRLRQVYAQFKPDERNALIDALFGGVSPRVPQTVAEVIADFAPKELSADESPQITLTPVPQTLSGPSSATPVAPDAALPDEPEEVTVTTEPAPATAQGADPLFD